MAKRRTSHAQIPRLALLGVVVALSACARSGDLFGPPPHDESVVDPRRVVSFTTLYRVNCAGCHGPRGEGGPAIGLGSPGYLASVSDAVIQRVIAEGRPKTAMPAFAASAGGMLGDAQIEALVTGIRAWATSAPDPERPHYEAATSGDPRRGAQVFREHCASCHGADGRGQQNVGSIVDDSFLDLVSEESLATTIIAGRPDLGCPDYRGVGATAMSTEDVADTVEWLQSQRQRFPGQPYPSATADRRAQNELE